MPLLILAGEEDFLLSRRIDELKEKIVDPAWTSFNFQRLDLIDTNQIIESALALPFGPGKKMIVLDRVNLFTKKRAKAGETQEKLSDKETKDILSNLEPAISSIAESTFLILACPFNFDSTLRMSKLFSKYAEIEAFTKERYFVGSHNPKLETWCRKEAKRFDVTIEDSAISYLLDSTEANLRQISKEIEKATIYIAPEKHIKLDVISNLSPYHFHVFSLLDHIAAERKQEAIACLNELLSRQSGIPILAAIQSTLSKWLRLKAILETLNSKLPTTTGGRKNELPIGEAAKQLSSILGLKPFAVEMDLKRIYKYTAMQIAEKRVMLCKLEHLVKTGQMSDLHALTLFVSS